MPENIKNKLPQQVAWHSLEPDVIFSRLTTGTGVLKTDEVLGRREQYGPNRLSPPKKRSSFERFAAQFRNVLIYVLLSAGALTALLGHWVDAGVIKEMLLPGNKGQIRLI